MNKKTNSVKPRVLILGLGYIGLPTAALIASKGIKVFGVDINPDIVAVVNSGRIHIVEPDLEGLVKYVVEKKYLTAATKPAKAEVFLIAVPTPFKENYKPDISYVKAATESIIDLLEPDNLVIIESTSPVGTTEEMAEIIFSRRPELKKKIYVAYCPERVLPGNILYELSHNDRVLGGIDKASAEKAKEFYSLFVEGKLYTTNARTAEMCKLVENSYRDVNIAFANELSMICDRLGINVWELIKMANCHPRVNILRPGAGVGGHCIAVDPWFIVAQVPELSRLIKTARLVNEEKAGFVVDKVIRYIKKIKPTAIACLGCTYKADIDDVRESPSVKIIASLAKKLPNWKIFLVEPHISKLIHPLNLYKNVQLSSLPTAITKSDVIILLVGHKVFLNVDRNLLKGKFVVDVCGLWENEK